MAPYGPGGEPSVSVNRYGTLLVGWMDWSGTASTPPGINEYAVSHDRGQNFSAAQPLPVSVQRYESDVSIAAGPANGTFWLGYQSQPTACSTGSSDATVTAAWNNATLLGGPRLSMPCADGEYYDREWLATTPNGTLFQVADVPIIARAAVPSPQLFVARSYNGTGFNAPVLVANGSYIAVGAAAYNDSLWAIGDTSYPAIACTIYLSHDGGSRWGPTAAALPSDCSSGVDPGAGIRGAEWQFAWGPGGALIAAYVNGSGIEVTRSSDLGSSWSPPELISGRVPPGTAFQTPTIAMNRTTGEVAVAWLDTRSGNTSWQVELAASSDDGATWKGPGTISDGTVGTGSKFWPGDFIGSTLTPWGTDAVVWGGEAPAGGLVPWFTQVPLVAYPVSFTEAGLPSGTRWSVTLSGTSLSSTDPTISFLEPDGTYPYVVGGVPGYAAQLPAGTVEVAGGNVSTAVDFSLVRYTVDFNETGLPAGTDWSISIVGEPGLDSSISTVQFSLPNGSYDYTCRGETGYTVIPPNGTLLVRGSAVFMAIVFAPVPPAVYAVTFEETGLPEGTVWSVTLDGTALSSATPVISFDRANGSYPYSVSALPGEVANPKSGRVNVTGSAPALTIDFTPSTLPGASTLPAGTLPGVALAVGLGALLIAGIVLYRRRARRPPAGPATPEGT